MSDGDQGRSRIDPLRICSAYTPSEDSAVRPYLRVAPPSMPLLSAVAPFEVRDPNLSMYWFYVSGIEFSLHIGERTPQEFQHCCFVRNQWHPVVVDPTVALSLGKLIANHS